jgi:micrococcal nuclease
VKKKTLRRAGLVLGIVLVLGMSFYNWYVYRHTEVVFLYAKDGDSAVFRKGQEEIEVRFLSIDCPEYEEELGKKAKEFTEEILKEGKKIRLVPEERSSEKDRYGRYLFWVYADGELLQEKLLEEGLAKIEYVYGDYDLLDVLEKAERQARENRKGIWVE